MNISRTHKPVTPKTLERLKNNVARTQELANKERGVQELEHADYFRRGSIASAIGTGAIISGAVLGFSTGAIRTGGFSLGYLAAGVAVGLLAGIAGAKAVLPEQGYESVKLGRPSEIANTADDAIVEYRDALLESIGNEELTQRENENTDWYAEFQPYNRILYDFPQRLKMLKDLEQQSSAQRL